MKYFAAILSLLLIGCCTKRYPTADDAGSQSSAKTTIATLKQMCDHTIITFTDDTALAITGTVISTDKQGYISGAIYIDDGTATAKILTGIYNSYVIYPEGSQITLSLPALSAKIENYQLVIGLTDDRDNTQLSEMDSQVILDRHITRHSTKKDVTPQPCTTNELSTLLCGKLVSISDLTFIDIYEDEQNPTGKLCTLSNISGDIVYLYIDSYSVGYNKQLPKDNVDITAIVTYGYIPQSGIYDIILLPRCSTDIGL